MELSTLISIIISVFTLLGSIGTIIFSAGAINAKIAQNTKDITKLTAEFETAKIKEAEAEKTRTDNAIKSENRLTRIESKLDTLLESITISNKIGV